MMYFSWLSGLKNDCNGSSLLRAHQMLLQSGQCQKWRHSHMILVNTTVRKDQNIRSVTDCTIYFDKQVIHCFFQTGIFIINSRNLCNFESILFHVLNLQKINICKDRIIDLEHLAVFCFFFQKISVCSDVYSRGCYHFLTDCVNRWICNLCK